VPAANDAAAPYRASVEADEAAGDAFGRAIEKLPPGQRLLVKARYALAQRASLFAKMRHRVTLDRRRDSGVGSYCQQGTGEQMQVYLELQFVEQEASLLQVANDRFLWLDCKLPTGRTVTRIDLRALRAEQRAWSGPTDTADGLGGAPFDESTLVFSARHGGLPGLLSSLLDNFQFMPPQAMRLSVTSPDSPEPKELAVFAIVGHWKPEKLAPIVAGNSPRSSDEGQRPRSVPNRIPEEVLLLVGQSDWMPYRIEYRRLETPPPTGDGAQLVAYKLSAEPLVVLELTDVVFDAPIAAGQFDYAPPGSVDWKDETAALIQRLRSQRQARIAESKPATLPSAAGR
jgi:hypothetical protein